MRPVARALRGQLSELLSAKVTESGRRLSAVVSDALSIMRYAHALSIIGIRSALMLRHVQMLPFSQFRFLWADCRRPT
jgi:hypothetical protein